MTNQGAKEYTFEALTDLWTGDADGKPGRTITTGLLGSIRWWFEVLARGLGGKACDPTKDGNRCPDQRKKHTEPGHHCVVCELFGCTGWARKFRFEVLDENGKAKAEQITKGQTFKLRFTPLRPILPQEWALLDLTLRLIAEYGAIGGRTVYKPTEESSRQSQQHHQDFGLVKLASSGPCGQLEEHELRRYISLPKWRSLNHGDFAWASLRNFWCVHGKHLSRQDATHSSFNKVLGRKEDKSVKEKKGNRVTRWSDLFQDKEARWLAGRQQESKKVFSFKDPPRTFGFVNPSTVGFGEMVERLKQASGFQESEFLEGRVILQTLLNRARGGNL